MKKLIMLLILICCFGCSNKDTRSINVLNWSSYIPNEVVKNFEEETGIKVNYSTYSSNEELLAKVSSAKEGTYDLIFPSDYMIEIMKTRNLIEKLDLSKLQNINNINKNYINLKYDKNNEYSVPFIAATTVIAVNREKNNTHIESYNDLLNEENKNEIVLIDDQRIIVGMALLANNYNMNSVSEEELEIAKNWLLKLKPNLKAYDSDSPKNFLISNEASIAVLWNAEGALASMENPNVENIFPKEGVFLSVDNFAIPKGAKNKDELYEFINYILREDVMKRIIESYPYKNVNLGTEKILNSEYLTNNAINIPDYVFENGLFVANIGDNISMYDRIWAEIK
jgi:spermidine/putrescine transport system substrate-binding protein/spermidine/putrescine transport system permease protein